MPSEVTCSLTGIATSGVQHFSYDYRFKYKKTDNPKSSVYEGEVVSASRDGVSFDPKEDLAVLNGLEDCKPNHSQDSFYANLTGVVANAGLIELRHEDNVPADYFDFFYRNAVGFASSSNTTVKPYDNFGFPGKWYEATVGTQRYTGLRKVYVCFPKQAPEGASAKYFVKKDSFRVEVTRTFYDGQQASYAVEYTFDGVIKEYTEGELQRSTVYTF